MTEEKKEQVEVFMCGPDVCKDKEGHEWTDDMVQIGPSTWSIVCKKCGIDKMSCDMWKDFP